MRRFYLRKCEGDDKAARLRRHLLASALGVAAASWAGTVLAQDASGGQGQPVELGPIEVEGGAGGSYRVDHGASQKQTAPLLDTPQTISVIPQAIIEEQGARNLTEVLRNTPGISFNAGENGFATSTNNFSLRGFDSSGNIFIDGSRDSGSYTRDMFNVEQVEVVKGPAADNGRGGAGGYINLVTKMPRLESFVAGDASYGFDEYDSDARRRLAADVNHPVSGTAALRLNVLLEDSGVAGREIAERNSWGVAPALALGLGTDLRGFLTFEHVEQQDLPDWGVPGATAKGTPLYDPLTRGASRDAFYGLASDFDDTTSDALTARLEYDISRTVTISNQTRFARVERDARYTLPTNYDAGTMQAITSTQFYSRVNTTLTNLTNVSTSFATGPVAHNLSAGLELTREESEAGRFGSNDPGNTSIFDPDPNRGGAVALSPTQQNGIEIDTVAVYVYDTASLTPQLELTGGLRAEHYRVEIDSTAGGAPTGNLDGFSKSESTLGGKVGLVYKPVPQGSIYSAFGVSSLPPGSYLSNPDISRTGDNAFPGFVAGAKGITSYNYEVGVKWSFFDERLSASAALFRTEKTNVPITGRDLGDTADSLKGYGEQIVQGIEFGVAGEITPAWSVFGGLALMDSERRHSAYLDEVRKRASPGDYGAYDRTSGDELAFTPRISGSLWTTYRLPFGLTIGGGLQHVGSSYLGRPDDANRIIPNGMFGKLPGFTVLNAMASYELTDNVHVRLNIDNVTDEEYAVTSNWNGRRVAWGNPRTFLVTTGFRF